MTNELEQLAKAIEIGVQASAKLTKSQMSLFGDPHHVAYTRTNAAGTVSNIQSKGAPTYKEHADKATAASAFANQTQKNYNYDSKEDAKVVASNHATAGHTHIEALANATTNKDIDEHANAVGRHMQANQSMAHFHRGNEVKHANNATDHANAFSEHAHNASATPPKNGTEVNKQVSLHLMAAEQHQRAAAAHSRVFMEESLSHLKDSADIHANHHMDRAREHGKKVQELTKLTINAGNHADKLTGMANASGHPEDHKEAAAMHRHAANMDYDSESIARHTAAAKEHDAKAEAYKPPAPEGDRTTFESNVTSWVQAKTGTSHGDASGIVDAHELRNLGFLDHHHAKGTTAAVAAEHILDKKPTEKKPMTEAEAGTLLRHASDHKVNNGMARKPEEWLDAKNNTVDAKHVAGTEAREHTMKEVYGHTSARPGQHEFTDEFMERQRDAAHDPFIMKHPNGNRYLVDTQGYNYARYVAKIKEEPKRYEAHGPNGKVTGISVPENEPKEPQTAAEKADMLTQKADDTNSLVDHEAARIVHLQAAGTHPKGSAKANYHLRMATYHAARP